jgi:hypothetical protein
MELDELRVFKRETSTNSHSTAITCAGVGRGATLVSTAITSSGKNGLVGTHSVDCSICHVVSHNTTALTIVHKEVQSKVLNEENAIVTEGSSEEGVEHRVTSSVSDCAASVGLAASTEVLGLTSEGTLIDLSFLCARERHTIRLKFEDSLRCFFSHVVNSVLIAKPVRTLHGVVEMPPPIVLVHVAECSVDSTLYLNRIKPLIKIKNIIFSRKEALIFID